MDTYTAVKNRLLVLLGERSMSINKLATESGVAPSSVKNILYGKSRNPGVVTLKMLCDGFGITLTEFFDTDEFKALEHRTKNTEFNVVVMEGSTLDTARIFTEGKVSVLNFANTHEPGGGVKHGARAKEECLCRCSNLYNALTTAELSQFYYQWHKQNTNYLFYDRVIYSPMFKLLNLMTINF